MFIQKPPVIPARHRNRIRDFIFVGGLQRHAHDFFGIKLDGAVCKRLAHRLQRGVVHLARAGIRSLRRRERINHQVNRSHVLADHFRGGALDFVREGVAVEARGKQTIAFRERMQSDGVVVARRRGLVAFGQPLEKHAQRLRSVAPGRRDARREAIAGGRADDQHIFRRVLACGNFPFYSRNPPLNVAAATFWMGIHTDEAARAALDGLKWHK